MVRTWLVAFLDRRDLRSRLELRWTWTLSGCTRARSPGRGPKCRWSATPSVPDPSDQAIEMAVVVVHQPPEVEQPTAYPIPRIRPIDPGRPMGRAGMPTARLRPSPHRRGMWCRSLLCRRRSERRRRTIYQHPRCGTRNGTPDAPAGLPSPGETSRPAAAETGAGRGPKGYTE